MPELTEATLFTPTVAGSLAPLLEDLGSLLALFEDERPMDARRSDARVLHRRVLDRADTLLRHAVPDDLRREHPAQRQRFCEAVLLWPLWATVASRPRHDSVRSVSLARFPIDLPQDVRAHAALRAALKSAVDADEAMLDQAQATVDRLVQNLAVKHAIAEHVAQRIEAAPDPGRERQRWLARIYGEVGWTEDEVDAVVTWSHVFFLLPYRGTRYVGARQLEDNEAARIRTFLVRVRDENTFVTGRFPAFGTWEDGAVHDALVDELLGAVRAAEGLAAVPREVIEQTLKTMVSLVPTPLSEQYLVHDAWGHAWQEALCDFEWLYGELVHVRDPIGVDILRKGLRIDAGRTELDLEAMLAAADHDLRHRIRCTHHAHTSEVLADMVEHKYWRRLRPADEDFPTSSILPWGTVKLDLSIDDAKRHARVWSSAWRRFLRDPGARVLAAKQLVDAGFPEDGLLAALDTAADAIETRFAAAFVVDWPAPEAEGDRVRVCTHQRMALQTAAIDAELSALLDWGDAVRADHPEVADWQVPEASMDLIALVLGWTYEADPDHYVWHLDELARRLKEPLARLGQALRAGDDDG